MTIIRPIAFATGRSSSTSASIRRLRTSATAISMIAPVPALGLASDSSSNMIASSPSIQTRSSTTLANLPSFRIVAQSVIDHPVKFAAGSVFLLSLMAIAKYQGAIKRRLQILRDESWLFGAGVTMERALDKNDNIIRTDGPFQNLKLLEINPEFLEQYGNEDNNDDWQLTTLGDYLSTLRPKGLPQRFSVDDMPKLLQREIESAMAAALLKALGPNMGRALLPAVGAGFVQQKAKGLAAKVAADWFLDNDDDNERDKGGIPITFMTLLTVVDANAKFNGNFNVHNHELEKTADIVTVGGAADDEKPENTESTAMQKMTSGEAVSGPSFVDKDITSSNGPLIPNDFVVSQHFDEAIRAMEAHLSGTDKGSRVQPTGLQMAQETVADQEIDPKSKLADGIPAETTAYDPEDIRLSEPVPVNPRLFPGLHLGYGKAVSSHTKREVLKMRLISVLLNKLGSNYYKRIRQEDANVFSVRMSSDSPPITTPWEFIECLIENGHEVDVVPTSRLTTFGVGLCVKEEDESWTSIPLGVFLESGYEDKDGNMALAMMPHSGLNMYIRGPLAGARRDGTPSELAIQHFIGIEGFCGWKNDANPVVPTNEPVPGGKVLTGKDAVRATRLAGLYATVLNGLATELELPFGGYGATAVCNDSAAIIQKCMYGGEPTIYPMTSIGRFAQRTIRYAQYMQNELQGCANMKEELTDLSLLTKSMKGLPSDINAAPSNAASAAKRLLHTLQPRMPLRLMTESKQVMESILKEEEQALLSQEDRSLVSSS